jgi:antitoxin MazE
MANRATLRVKKWGNSLAVRIPSSVARSVGFEAGQPVEISTQDSALVVTPVGDHQLTLSQKLALFDPGQHGGEQMASRPTGREIL